MQAARVATEAVLDGPPEAEESAARLFRDIEDRSAQLARHCHCLCPLTPSPRARRFAALGLHSKHDASELNHCASHVLCCLEVVRDDDICQSAFPKILHVYDIPHRF